MELTEEKRLAHALAYGLKVKSETVEDKILLARAHDYNEAKCVEAGWVERAKWHHERAKEFRLLAKEQSKSLRRAAREQS